MEITVEECQLTFLGFTDFELRNVEPVKILNVRKEPPSLLELFAKLFAFISFEARLTNLQSSFYELDVRSFSKSISYDCFVLVYSNRAGRVD